MVDPKELIQTKSIEPKQLKQLLPNNQQQLFDAVGPELKNLIGMIKPIYGYVSEKIKNGDLTVLREQLAIIKQSLSTEEGKKLLQETFSIIKPIIDDFYTEMEPLITDKVGPMINELINKQITSSGAIIAALTQIIVAPLIAFEEAINLFIMLSSVIKAFGETLVVSNGFQTRWQSFIQKNSGAISGLTSTIEKLISFLQNSVNLVVTSAKDTGKKLGAEAGKAVLNVAIPSSPTTRQIGGRILTSRLEFLTPSHISRQNINTKTTMKGGAGTQQIGGRIISSRSDFLASNRGT
jgi:hypothetical protein